MLIHGYVHTRGKIKRLQDCFDFVTGDLSELNLATNRTPLRTCTSMRARVRE